MHHQNVGWFSRILTYWRHHYTERQVYIRSHGQVQFMSLSPLTQAAFAAIAFVFLGWVAFASVNVVFKEQIIASKDQRYRKMQGAYEERMAQLQSAYDELNGQLVISEERFLATTRQLEEKHNQLAALMAARQTASNELDVMRQRYAATSKPPSDSDRGNSLLMRADQASTKTTVLNTTTRPQQSAELEAVGGPAQSESGIDFSSLLRSYQNETASHIETRLDALAEAQQSFINTVEEKTDRRVRELKSIMRMTKVIDPDTFVGRNSSDDDETGQGGPFISLTGNADGEGEGNTSFNRQLFRVSRNLKEEAKLTESISRIPLASPLTHYRITSDFGPRRDPFNGRMGFHPGLDMASAYGAPVYAPGEGVVTFAGWKSGYGRFVEISMGNGFSTRYGHLSRIDVKAGQKVAFRQVIGRVGSTGRSTGPHLHYEVKYDGIVRDPLKFIEAGQYVFSKQG
ncbi:M23 family metallopeptidase [Parvibaculum sp. MBR-TMA-1.3b-4.2]|jgi:murein DD-endopeptidase MepM/ murein hydrolase activator NlpD